jgi:osmotically-inducible protein OsmY
MRLTHIIKRTSVTLAGVTIMNLTALAADQKVDANNTATNQRDRSGETKTSGDQSNTSHDLQITQAIRRGLMKDDNLSSDAKNIKVITANGQVTLRGPVNNAREKTKVEQIAKSAAGDAQIVDQLDVKNQNNKQP